MLKSVFAIEFKSITFWLPKPCEAVLLFSMEYSSKHKILVFQRMWKACSTDGSHDSAVITVIAVELNTPAFDCRVGTTPQMCNRVSNTSDIGILNRDCCAFLKLSKYGNSKLETEITINCMIFLENLIYYYIN